MTVTWAQIKEQLEKASREVASWPQSMRDRIVLKPKEETK